MTMFAGLVGGWLGTPMFEDRADRLSQGIIIAVAVTCYVVGIYFIPRNLDPGPLARGDARWRYRSRALRERIGRARNSLALIDRKPAWWATRIELAIAIVAAAVPPALVPVVLDQQSMFGRSASIDPLAMLGLAEASILVGLAWMVRIYRAPLRNDAKAYWRYRDGA
jgi:hypothetical protein